MKVGYKKPPSTGEIRIYFETIKIRGLSFSSVDHTVDMNDKFSSILIVSTICKPPILGADGDAASVFVVLK